MTALSDAQQPGGGECNAAEQASDINNVKVQHRHCVYTCHASRTRSFTAI